MRLLIIIFSLSIFFFSFSQTKSPNLIIGYKNHPQTDTLIHFYNDNGDLTKEIGKDYKTICRMYNLIE